MAPPYLPCPPKTYGGVEQVVATLANGLVDAGHEVTLFAHPGSVTAAELISPEVELSTGFSFAEDAVHAAAAVDQLSRFDLVHNHSVALLLYRAWFRAHLLTTIHHPAVGPVYRAAADERYISISRNQRVRGLRTLNWVSNIYLGVDVSIFSPSKTGRREFLLHLGALAERKGTGDAVQVALHSGRRLVLAGPMSPNERPYLEREVLPYIDGKQIEYVGEVNVAQKTQLYQRAEALLLPARWDEPFGLVMTEAGACGTPVLAYRRGAVPEIVVDGVTGYLGDSVADLVSACTRLDRIAPDDCRGRVVEAFSTDAMIQAHLRLYEAELGYVGR